MISSKSFVHVLLRTCCYGLPLKCFNVIQQFEKAEWLKMNTRNICLLNLRYSEINSVTYLPLYPKESFAGDVQTSEGRIGLESVNCSKYVSNNPN